MNRRKISVLCLAVLWGALTLGLWLGPRQQISEGERRPLAQFPELTGKAVFSGRFMEAFADFTLDQFPLRDGFRTLKAAFHTYALGQRDSNGIYIAQGHAAQLNYPLDRDSLDHAANRLNYLYNTYLEDSRVVMAIVPDKGCYLAEASGRPALDYGAMVTYFRETLPWAQVLDLRDTLSLSSYYRTDTHWRQECLLPSAEVLCESLGVSAPKGEDFTPVTLAEPFPGVYAGQAALPLEADSLTMLTSPLLENCTVYNWETDQEGTVYDLAKAEGSDLYEVFLSGPRSLLTIHNPAGQPGKELIVFRDSFGSAMVPLLVEDYETVTLVDIRYLQSAMLNKYLDFSGQDVLILYSTLVLNNSETMK